MLKDWQDVFHQQQKKGILQYVSPYLEYYFLSSALRAKDQEQCFR